MAIRIPSTLGMLILSIWLILMGVSAVITLSVPGPVMGVLALVAGILILIGR